MSRITWAALLALGLVLAAGCGEESEDNGGASPQADAGGEDAGGEDAGGEDAGGEDAEIPDAEIPDAETPDADLPDATVAAPLEAVFGAAREEASQAGYGLSAPEVEGGPWTLYVEAWEGGFTGCPTEASPTPRWTFILSGLEVDAAGELTTQGTLAGTVLDYRETLLGGEVFARAEAVTVEIREATLCVPCVGQAAPSHPEGRVALEVEATFPGGVVRGGLVATHCDSLDAP